VQTVDDAQCDVWGFESDESMQLKVKIDCGYTLSENKNKKIIKNIFI
jgi:hypothetical protein